MKRVLARTLATSMAALVILLGLVTAPTFGAKPTADKVTKGPWGQGVAVVDPTVPANAVTPSDYAAVNLTITLTDPGLSWDNGPNNVIGGCGAPVCLPSVMVPGVYKFPYVAGTDGIVAEAGGHFNLHGLDARGRMVSIRLTIQSDVGFANLPLWATP